MKTVIFTVEIETRLGMTNFKCEEILNELEDVLAKKSYELHDSSYERSEA